MYPRWIEEKIRRNLLKPFVHILFGARQTGKSTLLKKMLPANSLKLDLSDPGERSRYLARPERFAQWCKDSRPARGGTTVFVDEVQNVPSIFDSVQHLYDSEPRRWRFVLCGSSVRKLRAGSVNLLPGRSMRYQLWPLVMPEQEPPMGNSEAGQKLVLMKKPSATGSLFPSMDLVDRLAYGALPGVLGMPVADRAEILKTYAQSHLEEELRRESIVRQWSGFLRFLELAAQSSGQIVNYTSISNESGVSIPTVKAHYSILEDMFIGFHLPAFSKSPRKSALSTPRFFFFDLGVRHAAAGIRPGRTTVNANPGPLFEQWVGIELWKRLQYLGNGRLSYFRTSDGAEIDFILEKGSTCTPIEVKWTTNPTIKDARHLLSFMNEMGKKAPKGYIVCRCSSPIKLSERITALPWHMI